MIRTLSLSMMLVLCMMSLTSAQSLDGSSYIPGKDPDIDMYLSSWKNSMPRHTHGSLVERDILTRGDPLKPTRKGAVLKYINHFSFATLDAHDSTQPTTLKGEQEIIYINSGKGTIKSGRKTHDLHNGICLLIPANLKFTITNTGNEPLTMYLINEPIPEGFRPNKEILVRDENKQPISSTRGHWVHIVKGLFSTKDGLGTLESVITVAFDPMTIGHPHSHVEGCEEVWTQLDGTSIVFIGKQIRMQEPGMGYMIPPDSNTPHSNINISKQQVKMFYFARYREHEARK